MASAGEVSQEIGRSYVQVLTDALQAVVPRFQSIFNVYQNPEKLSFSASGRHFSFDVRGILRGAETIEVFVECKARTVGSDLLPAYREFLAKSWMMAHMDEHKYDVYWFATNVPFGCEAGLSLTSIGFVASQLRAYREETGAEFDLPELQIADFVKRVSVCVLTDSQMRRMELVHYVRPGETLWDITRSLHGFQLPSVASDMYQPYARRIAGLNHLADPDLLIPGGPIHIPWEGMQ